jgi:hypothetical protein
MKEIYKKIFDLAMPYYLEGRPYDVSQVEWMMTQVEELVKREHLNEDLLMPLCILHDIGYSKVTETNPSPKSKEAKIVHMAEGAKLAREILDEVEYDKTLADQIVRYVSVHDNWLLNDDTPYKECREMAAFNDLDFIYAVSGMPVLKTQAESMQKTETEMLDFWLHDEKLERRPFCCSYTKKMFYEYIDNLKILIGQ